MSPEIKGLVTDRRKALGKIPAMQSTAVACEEPLWGLALSGGGIRSATFCLGLVQALAKRNLLLRFDLLSTVSGGGYTGSFLGRLFSRAGSGADVAQILQSLRDGSNRWFTWWLRANGRYLVPSGVKDQLYAFAIYFRNMLGVHIELGLLGILLGAVLSFVDATIWSSFAAHIYGPRFEPFRDWIHLFPTPWLVLMPLAFAILATCWSFWMITWVVRSFWSLVAIGIVAVAAAGGILGLNAWMPLDEDVYRITPTTEIGWILLFVGLNWLGSAVLAYATWAWALTNVGGGTMRNPDGRIDQRYDAARNALTKLLASLFRAAVFILVIGLLDRCAWWLAFDEKHLASTAYVLAGAAAAFRMILSPTSSLRTQVTNHKLLAPILSIVGRLATFALMTFWIAVVQHFALGAIFVLKTPDFSAPNLWVICIAGTIIPYMLLTGMNTRFLNLSSLHGFYRARLIRSYLGASNPDRFRYPDGLAVPGMRATDPVVIPYQDSPRIVSDDAPEDDVSMAWYAPHRHGGPVHLLNVCLNETRSPRGGLFNQDRKGRALTVAPGGFIRVGVDSWQKITDTSEQLTLGSWMAISGAAISPGLGSQTRGGISALAMFAGARLGYWWDSMAINQVVGKLRLPWAKTLGLLYETLGAFKGKSGRDWFLTDGGHFENTGAYALLVERSDFIVVADCGADSAYEFNDLENLVRKARIDLQTEIVFLKPRKLDPDNPKGRRERAVLDVFGSLNEIASDGSGACFALARIQYPRETGPYAATKGRQGYLLIVKPNMCKGLPVDLVHFKRDFPEFPQQGTADQFFSEAQWESYFRLGAILGSQLSRRRIEYLLSVADIEFVEDDGSPLQSPASDSASDAASGGLPARIVAGAVTTSVGLGALGVVGAVGVGAWQGISAYRNTVMEHAKVEEAALKELTDSWAAQSSGASAEAKLKAVNSTAAIISRFGDTFCKDGSATWFNQSHLAVEILADTIQDCKSLEPTSEVCARLINTFSAVAGAGRSSCLFSGTTISEEVERGDRCARYWGYDYRKHATLSCVNPKDPLKASPREVEKGESWDVDLGPGVDASIKNPVAIRKKYEACDGHLVAPYFIGPEAPERFLDVAKAWRANGLDVEQASDVSQVATAGLMRFSAGPSTTVVIRFYDGASLKCAQTLSSDLSKDTVLLTPIYSSSEHRIGLIEVLALPGPQAQEPRVIEPPKVADVGPIQGGDRIYIFNGDSGSKTPVANGCEKVPEKKPRPPRPPRIDHQPRCAVEGSAVRLIPEQRGDLELLKSDRSE